jgi:hypothetical protein
MLLLAPSSVQTFCKLLSSQKDDNWPLPMMYVLCLDLRAIAGNVDQHMERHGGKPGDQPGVDTMITSFCEFCQLSAEKSAFFSSTNVMIKLLQKLAIV